MPAPSSYEFATALNVSAQGLVKTAIEAGAGAGKLVIFSDADVVLATIPLDDPLPAVDGNGQLSLTAPASVASVAADDATWGEVRDSDDTFVFRAPVSQGTSAVSGQIVLNAISITLGADVELISFTVG